MRKFLTLAAVAVSLTAWAGDKLLGVIVVSDGGTVSNATTGYGSAGCSRQQDPGGAGACAQAFPIGPSTLLSIQCRDNSAMFAANKRTTDAGEGIKLAADQFLTTSTAAQSFYVPPISGSNNGMPDGGSYVGGIVSISPIAGSADARCAVFSRQGNE